MPTTVCIYLGFLPPQLDLASGGSQAEKASALIPAPKRAPWAL